ncbi:MAG: glycine--tRNA ligase subunit beta [Planctomycetes bacterium]|nr:glycine--tRNA ligase subunit beta [Planctomycetota bacterium]
MPDLLLELGSEEIPAGFLAKALKDLRDLARKRLSEAGLSPGEVKGAATPRRLAIWVGGLAARTEDVKEEKVGPRAAAAFKDGKPTVAAERFAASLGLTVEQLETREVKKGKQTAEYLVGTREVAGRSASEILAEEIPAWIEGLSFKKSMRWVAGSRLRFTRPLRRITALLDGAPIATSFNGIASGTQIEGHRFLHPEPLPLTSSDWGAYLALLREHHVIADPAERRALIVKGLAEHLEPAQLEARGKLIDEVTNLVEWPQVDVGEFPPRFLELPDVVIVDAMVDHQRYFPIRKDGELLPRFAFVANRPLDPVIREGNQRVLGARLEDALFFFRLDQKRPLNERVDDLDEVVFMQELGSYKARIERIDALALAVAEGIGLLNSADSGPTTGREKTRAFGPQDKLGMRIRQAARLARTDLTTEVVQEFPGLQGQIGAIYARLQDEPEEVAVAIGEAYLPRGEGDVLPQSPIGTCLSLADKLDTVVCAFATGRGPTGSKDPFMVRRNVLGILRILGERELDCGYAGLVRNAVAGLPEELRSDTLAPEVLDYMRGRLEVLGKDAGFDIQHVRAALPTGRDPSNVHDFWIRLRALKELAQDARFATLCTLVERCRNITEKNGPTVDPEDVDTSRLEHPAERALHEAIEACRPNVSALIENRDYAEAGAAYVGALGEVVHTFFEPAPTGVFVMDEDPRLRTNRLALLKQVHGLLARGFVDLAEVPRS